MLNAVRSFEKVGSKHMGAEPTPLLHANEQMNSSIIQLLDPTDVMRLNGVGSYDNADEDQCGRFVLLPSVFPQRTCDHWNAEFGGFWPTASETREEAWAEIMDFYNSGERTEGEDELPRGCPRMLVDSWDNSKRSREYLNSTEDNLDSTYYSHALRD